MTLEEQLFSLMDHYKLTHISIGVYTMDDNRRFVSASMHGGEIGTGDSLHEPSAKEAINAAITALQAKRLKLAPVTDVPAIEGLAA